MMDWRILPLLMLCACALPVGSAEASECVTPEIIGVDQGAIQNAGAGAGIWNGGPGNGVTNLVRYALRVSDHAVNSMIRVSWADYEMKEGEYGFQKMDKHFAYCLQYGQKLESAVL